jgi:hypothetical protein
MRAYIHAHNYATVRKSGNDPALKIAARPFLFYKQKVTSA